MKANEKKGHRACMHAGFFFFLRACAQACIAGWQAGGSQDSLG